MDDICPSAEKCPIFTGVLKGKVYTTKAYRSQYCQAGGQGRNRCKRFQCKERYGQVPEKLLPNSPKSLNAIGRENHWPEVPAMKSDPYKKCPVYESDRFTLRLVAESDAGDLLQCYSDADAVKIMNSDRCTSDFYYTTIAEMLDCIKFWLEEYAEKSYVRFAIVSKQIQKPVGTVEIFGGECGVLRIDLRSDYEKQEYISELLQTAIEHFYDAFRLEYMITKAIPLAAPRISALIENGFSPDDTFRPDKHYYVRKRSDEARSKR